MMAAFAAMNIVLGIANAGLGIAEKKAAEKH